VKPEVDWFFQEKLGHWASGDVESIEDEKTALHPIRGELLTDDGASSRRGISDENWLSA
jgi:hypothetical protein